MVDPDRDRRGLRRFHAVAWQHRISASNPLDGVGGFAIVGTGYSGACGHGKVHLQSSFARSGPKCSILAASADNLCAVRTCCPRSFVHRVLCYDNPCPARLFHFRPIRTIDSHRWRGLPGPTTQSPCGHSDGSDHDFCSQCSVFLTETRFTARLPRHCRGNALQDRANRSGLDPEQALGRHALFYYLNDVNFVAENWADALETAHTARVWLISCLVSLVSPALQHCATRRWRGMSGSTFCNPCARMRSCLSKSLDPSVIKQRNPRISSLVRDPH